MNIKWLSVLLLVFGLHIVAQGQSSSKKKSDKAKSPSESAAYDENSKAPSSATTIKTTTSKRKSRKKQPIIYDQLVVEQKELMEANVKKYNKIAKELEKPQYSDPMYFGHKKKPKKRPPGKKKFCKECQMWH